MSEPYGSANSGTTLAMQVANTGFMLDRLGQDCSPLQFLRELSQNSIEAIIAAGEPGEVIWDVDWNRFDLTGVYKLACIDTGVGMTGEEMLTYINMLSSSVHEQSHETNFGVGAKVAAATRNHAGLVYLSWKDGVGSMIHLWRDPVTGQYGLQQIERPDGTFGHWAHVTDDIKPEPIRDHGTMVVLLGNDVDADTMTAGKEVPSPSRWAARYLNTRYFRFPEQVTVKAREGWENPRTNTDSNVLRTITGQEAYLDSHSDASGTVELAGASAHWWILRDEAALSQNSGFIASNGHMAALFQDELHELVTARAGVARLQQFGVIFGYHRVVIYVQPTVEPGHTLLSNTARTHLLIDGEPLPWADWASDFRDSMPDEIDSLMDAVIAGSTAADHKQSIKERLKQIRDLFRVSRYRPTPAGTLTLDAAETTRGGKPRDNEATTNGTSSSSGGRGGRAGDVYALFLASEGPAGERITADLDPDVKWITTHEGTRTPPHLEDRAAKYLPEKNLLQINADFRVFEDMVDRWCEIYEDAPGARPLVEDVVREWFEQALVETIIGLQALQGSQHWTVENLKNAWSEEALTTAVMQRYHVDMNVRRTLGSKFGSRKERSALLSSS
jgi:hypothetical protein